LKNNVINGYIKYLFNPAKVIGQQFCLRGNSIS